MGNNARDQFAQFLDVAASDLKMLLELEAEDPMVKAEREEEVEGLMEEHGFTYALARECLGIAYGAFATIHVVQQKALMDDIRGSISRLADSIGIDLPSSACDKDCGSCDEDHAEQVRNDLGIPRTAKRKSDPEAEALKANAAPAVLDSPDLPPVELPE